MMICVFSFLPETPIQDQTIYIIKAYHAATRVVTLFSSLAEQRRIIEYPIYIRQPVSLAAFILFRLHLSPLLLPQYVESSRQSVVTVHRLFRNMLTAWKDVENDISRTAKVLEKLNFVIISHPELFTKAPGIITRMRSHLTASLFYELIGQFMRLVGAAVLVRPQPTRLLLSLLLLPPRQRKITTSPAMVNQTNSSSRLAIR